MANLKDKGGRPTKYKKEFDEQARKLCAKGFIDTEIADFFNVDVSTINRWKLSHESFCESLKSAKRHSDSKVEDSLYNRALGYEYEEVKEESEGGTITKTTRTRKQLAGDTTAQIFWLKNRQPDRWRDKTETKVTLSDDFDSLLDESLNDEE